ncbi:hypothetical protein DCAR_0205306 [Daucus carota subsp. sativus]|uniref:Uncharacterized protein n=1 Tax=Daucus carota subsp. sativus TaxID=79200 RepID=A0A175Y9Q5_DAUCS|nr:hypothetical protein DCAR_0205306 [Daucus carota subsp. sativus]
MGTGEDEGIKRVVFGWCRKEEMLGCRVLYVGAYVIAGYGVVVEGGWFEQGGGEVSLELERTTARERIDMWLGLNRRKKARLLFIEIAVRH